MNKVTPPSDSVADVNEDLKKCPRCGATTRLDEATCINCLLVEGLETKGEPSRETFESILVEANVTDTRWRLGHYEILEEIGRGGMGVIYRARQQHSRRIVAVKRVLAHQVNSHETLVRFRREAEAVASLDHPNILPIHEVSESEEGLPYFSMKYATGGSLRAAAPTLGKDPRKCVRLMAKVARGIAYAHAKGILHRDLQPGNILLDENGEPLVSDFGLAKWLDQGSDLTRTLETLGTPGYIAPEQAERPADKLTCAADVYSLGAILFYLLTGRPAFVGSNVLHVIHQAAATPAPRLRSVAPSLDRDLETIVGRCLESDPNARYQSAGAMAEDLEHWVRHEPIRARRTGIFVRARKWVRRNPTSTRLIASLIVHAAAIVGVMFWKNESPHPTPSLPAGIAVLPLQNLSEEKENAYLADGIQDELLTNLSKIRDLKVISRTSVMQYKSGITRNLKEIAQQLGVSNLVEGSVRRSGNHVRVSVQLIDAQTNRHLWAQNYDRTLADSVALQGNLATEIAAVVGATLSPQDKARVQAKPTKNTAAYDAYLRGRAYAARSYQKSYEDKAIQSYQEAVRLDPSFALAWARLSIAVGHNPWDPSPAWLALVKDAADHAVALDPNLPETHLAVGYYRYGQRDYLGALSEFQQAEQGLPNNAEVIEAAALVQRRLGHWEEAITGLRRTIELDPRYHDAYENLAGTYRWLRHFPETLATVDQLLAWEPNDPIALGRKAAALWAMGDLQAVEPLLTNPGFDPYDRGVQALFQRRYATAIEIFSAPPPSNLAPSPSTSERALFLGLSQQRAGDVAAARATCQKAVQDFQRELEKVVPGSWAEAWLRTCLGRAYAGLGEAASAIAEGEKAIAIDPTSKNAVDGPVREEKMANIYALLGDADHAIPILKRLLQTTYAGAITPALLRLDPIWDRIRNDPRFQELAAEGKPILEKSIAVLPFENLGTDPENAFFADGVQDEILNNLAKIAELKVISRTSVLQYKSGAKRNLRQIASELGVAHVVEGSVQRAANRVRVAAKLTDARTNTHLWEEDYDRPLDNVFAIQSEIAQAIAAQLQAKLSPNERAAIEELPTSDLVAYDLYLKAKELIYNGRFNPGRWERGVFKAVQLLDEAVTRDPTFLLAHCQLARANDQIYFANWDHTETRLALAQSSVEAAVRLQPHSGETHLAQANHLFKGYLNYDGAREELAKAQRVLPNDAEVFRLLGGMCRWQGRWEEARQNLQRAVELDPRNTSTLTDLAWVYIALRKYEEADAIASRLQALEPRSPILRSGRAWIGLWWRADAASLRAVLNAIEAEGSQPAAEVADLSFQLAFYERDPVGAARALDSMPREGRIDMNGVPFPHSWYEGLLAKLRQDAAAAHSAFASARAETEQLVHAEPGNVKPLAVLALIDAELGGKEQAIHEGRTACDMLPPTKDAVDGVWLMTNLARIYALTGEHDLALRQLEVLSKLPSSWFGMHYGDLRLNPEWDSVRNNPRFEKVLEESKKPFAMQLL